jgi:hypothetical protein
MNVKTESMSGKIESSDTHLFALAQSEKWLVSAEAGSNRICASLCGEKNAKDGIEC